MLSSILSGLAGGVSKGLESRRAHEKELRAEQRETEKERREAEKWDREHRLNLALYDLKVDQSILEGDKVLGKLVEEGVIDPDTAMSTREQRIRALGKDPKKYTPTRKTQNFVSEDVSPVYGIDTSVLRRRSPEGGLSLPGRDLNNPLQTPSLVNPLQMPSVSLSRTPSWARSDAHAKPMGQKAIEQYALNQTSPTREWHPPLPKPPEDALYESTYSTEDLGHYETGEEDVPIFQSPAQKALKKTRPLVIPRQMGTDGRPFIGLHDPTTGSPLLGPDGEPIQLPQWFNENDPRNPATATVQWRSVDGSQVPGGKPGEIWTLATRDGRPVMQEGKKAPVAYLYKRPIDKTNIKSFSTTRGDKEFIVWVDPDAPDRVVASVAIGDAPIGQLKDGVDSMDAAGLLNMYYKLHDPNSLVVNSLAPDVVTYLRSYVKAALDEKLRRSKLIPNRSPDSPANPVAPGLH